MFHCAEGVPCSREIDTVERPPKQFDAGPWTCIEHQLTSGERLLTDDTSPVSIEPRTARTASMARFRARSRNRRAQ